MPKETVLIRFLISTCNYKRGQKKRVDKRVALKWERKRIAKIIKPKQVENA